MSTRNPTKTAVLFFGAGASKACGLPAQAELLMDLERSLGTVSAEGIVAEYLRRCFPGFREVGPPSFEQAYGILDSLVNEHHPIHAGGATLRNTVTKQAMEVVVTRRLRSPSRWPSVRDDSSETEWQAHYEPSPNAVSPYARLLHRLDHHGAIGSVCLVNMNYDVLLDRSFRCPRFGHNPAYGIRFLDQALGSSGYIGSPTDGDIPLLKPHGSLNWLYCPICEDLIFTGNGVFESPLCQNCSNLADRWSPTVNHRVQRRATIRRPLLIMPNTVQAFEASVWEPLHEQMFYYLRNSSIWVFIGYSLPLSDTWLVRALMESRASGTTPLTHVEVVLAPERDEEKIKTENDDVFSRYQCLLDGPGTTLKSHRVGFAEWVDGEGLEGLIQTIQVERRR